MDIETISSRLDELKQRKKELTLKHGQALRSIDAQIRGLHEKRGLIAIKHKEVTDRLDREIAELNRDAKRVQAEKARAAQVARASQEHAQAARAPAPATAAPKSPGASIDDIRTAIVGLLKGRADMSESLLREKLRAKRMNVAELSKQLDKMVSDGLLHRRANNYSLGKRR
jgi:biotin carboxyl carrier protein